MKALVEREWAGGYLDYYRPPDEYRIRVLVWKSLAALDSLYFVRPRSLRLVWNYLWEVGPVTVLRKIRSRSQERGRNEKFVACGLGEVIESADEARFPTGQIVAFLAPGHPPCAERIVLPGELLLQVDVAEMRDLPAEGILYQRVTDLDPDLEGWWSPVRGWNRCSGSPLPPHETRSLVARGSEVLQQIEWHRAEYLPVDRRAAVRERTTSAPCAHAQGRGIESSARHALTPGPSPNPGRGEESSAAVTPRPGLGEGPGVRAKTERPCPPGRKRAVLFGYGNYAKTIILPNVGSCLSVEAIHEIDPMQIPRHPDGRIVWETSPIPRADEEFDVYLIAGFHHTHAPLALHALQGDACAVVEKPIVVDDTQLAALLAAMRTSSGRLFSCFHKRYLPLNRLAIRDLGLRPGDPVSYHCIVYEVPLPELHWYRWPNSRSRLVSNGCHWLDHFLFLNDFADVRSIDLFVAADETINCSVELANGALFTMVLTDRGSERIGVQDYIELRANGATIRMTNGAEYVAEGSDRILRRTRINKTLSYKAMYQQIGRTILEGGPGDSARSVEVSAGLMLALEERLVEQMSGERGGRSPRSPDVLRIPLLARE